MGCWDENALSPIGSIKILTYYIRESWVYLPCLFTNCITRSCDLLDFHSNLCRIDVDRRHDASLELFNDQTV